MEKHEKLSVFLSLILRHKPEVIGLTLDNQGYLKVDELIKGVNESGRKIDLKILHEIVDTDNKGRYSFTDDNMKIRANQGHSIEVDLSLESDIPSGGIYHGTAEKFKESILNRGLLKGKRQYVHLSNDIKTAFEVGSRRGDPIVFLVDYVQMIEDGYELKLSKNNVWLSNDIPPKYLQTLVNIDHLKE